jgi:hypothetical protein
VIPNTPPPLPKKKSEKEFVPNIVKEEKSSAAEAKPFKRCTYRFLFIPILIVNSAKEGRTSSTETSD